MSGMLSLNSLSTRLLYNTVRITAQVAGGGLSVGTGFFFEFRVDDQHYLPVLVTNKHVVEGAIGIEILVHEAVTGGNGQRVPGPNSFTLPLPPPPQLWVGHPGDIDLCALPIAPSLDQASASGRDVFYNAFDEQLLPSDDVLGDLAALEEVTMVGYPNGLWDHVNNYPILRRGITATHPLVDFNGKPEGVVDIAAFPGSSGSPVLILNQGSYATARGVTIGTRIWLLGALHAGPQFTADGRIEIVDIPTAVVPVVSTRIPLHLGYYVKAKELRVLGQHMLVTTALLQQPGDREPEGE